MVCSVRCHLSVSVLLVWNFDRSDNKDPTSVTTYNFGLMSNQKRVQLVACSGKTAAVRPQAQVAVMTVNTCCITKPHIEVLRMVGLF